MASVFPIVAGTQSYDWGRVGLDSKAAQYALNSIPDFKLEETKPYAEVRSIDSSTQVDSHVNSRQVMDGNSFDVTISPHWH